MLIKAMYTVFIGVLLATFIGVGVAAFYPQPKYPEPPESLSYPLKEKMSDEEVEKQVAEQKEYNSIQREFQKQINVYNRNVSIVVLVFAIVVLVVSLTLFKKLQVIADGLLLGGVVTLLYSIIRGFATEDNKFRFVVVTVGLIVSLVLGYIKFITPKPNAK